MKFYAANCLTSGKYLITSMLKQCLYSQNYRYSALVTNLIFGSPKLKPRLF